ncbi:unnamed protein product [Cyclocybe aegerita]|uniref:Uncharacterized protein n=1 Tax=Cyclocybe aegerita TaxID=1973307 RepID=A0A8S0XLL1_CYCAE|nr:unnamed protein product [Cyclocybe aegerita]
MPSIRVKGRAYTALDDVFPELNVHPPDSGTSQDANPRSSQLQPRLSLPFLRQTDAQTITSSTSPGLTSPGRRRSSTTTSLIHAHCTRSPRLSQFRNSQLGEEDSPLSPLRSSPDGISPSQPYPGVGEMLTIGGQQADIRIASSGEPGLVESSINLPHPADARSEEHYFSDHHHDDVVEHLDVIDSQVGAFASLTNAANSIVIPPSSWYSRRPVVVLPTVPRRSDGGEDSEQFEDSLDRHVDDVLKRPSKVRRTLMGVWSFLKTPMGIITGIYGFLVVFWGAAIVIFLAKIIDFHNANTQGFWVEVSSQVETGLFTVTSIGLIPYRVLDTYRIWKIWRYKRKTMKLREKAGLPQLFDVDDLPDPVYDPNYVHVLTEEEQRDLHRQQRKFQYSQTWYRAHGTETHRAFPISMALWICFLNDGNSIFQIFLCGTMWGMNRFQRPAWTTGLLIPASFLCGIGAAVVIWRGGERTKRVEEVKERLRAALAERRPTKDGQLPQSFSRNPKPTSASQTPMLDAIDEKTRTQTIDTATTIDEHMSVPPAGQLKEHS